jgi:transcriptional regulator with XRE-family HTH domain
VTDFAAYLRAARLAAKLTQSQLAGASGLDQPRLSRLEKGRRRATLDETLRLARVLGVSLQWFLSGRNFPGSGVADIALELRRLGVVDLLVPKATVPGAFRPPEHIVALAASGDQPEPRIIEALPAVLAWRRSWSLPLLRAVCRSDRRALTRLAWLADIALTIHRQRGFPGGCPGQRSLERLVRATRALPPSEADDLGYAAGAVRLPPVSRAWNISYAAGLKTFEDRAAHLADIAAQARGEVLAHG